MPKRGIPDFQRQHARQLRRRPSVAEARLWGGLRQLRRLGLAHFRRRAPIGPHIVAFVDLARRVVVETDGGQHAGEDGGGREAFLRREGYLVLRFSEGEILADLDGVLASIMGAVRTTPPTLALPPRGRESRHERAAGSPPPRGEGMRVGRRRGAPPERGD